MKILVTGSHIWCNQALIEQIFQVYPKDSILVEGEASGVDTISAYVCRKMEFKVRPYDPIKLGYKWPEAGPLRNSRMLEDEHPDKDGMYIDVCIAIHWDPNLGRGTKDMVQKVLKAEPKIELCRHIFSKRMAMA
jgi:hypothetical protein